MKIKHKNKKDKKNTDKIVIGGLRHKIMLSLGIILLIAFIATYTVYMINITK